MIWIKNHGISDESDNLRIPLVEEIDEISSHKDDPESCPAIVVMKGWAAVKVDSDVSDVRDGFEGALGPQLRFAVDEDANHDDYDNKAEELTAIYDGEHPGQS